MKKIFLIVKLFVALIYLSITVTIAVLLFMDIEGWGNKLIKKMDYKVSEKYNGGQITDVIDNGAYIMRIHKTVFDGFFKERKKGFIQIDWFSNELLPNYINEKVDYNKDDIIDFKIDLYTDENRAVITSYNDKILNIMDKTSMGNLIMEGYDDGRNGVFYYNDYKEALFLGYSINELNTLDTIKNLIIPEDKKIFNDLIADIVKGNKVNNIEIGIINKFNKNNEKININYSTIKDKGKTKHKITFKLINKNANQQMVILTSVKDINKDFTVFPKTVYKEGKSVRVLLKK